MFQNRLHNYNEIEKIRNSNLLVYITGDRPGLETQIHNDVLDYFVNHLDKFEKKNKITLYLYTRGGNTLAAWSLINLIQQFCKEYEVIVPSKAHSAGTLISLGAKTIIMTKQSTLGPIDPSLNTPLNPQNPLAPGNPMMRVPVSVESIKGYFELAKQELKIENQNNLSNILINLSKEVHPLVLGDVFRARTQIQMLSRKLLSKHIKDKKLINKIISFLCSDSGSHDYTIYRKEAKEELGLNIEKPNDDLYKIIKEIYDDIYKELELSTSFDPNILIGQNNKLDYKYRRCLIETINGKTDVFISEGKLTKKIINIPSPPPLPPIQQNVVNDERLFEGWKHEE